MEQFLTRKARPVWLLRALEALQVVAYAIWLAAGLSVMLDDPPYGLELVEIIAYLLLFGLPCWVLVRIIRAWKLRAKARKLAETLAWETTDEIQWTTLDEHTGVGDSQRLVEKLHRKGYLRNITPDFDKLTLHRAPADTGAAEGAPSVRKCPMCGAQLERRTFGDWACRYCGTVAGK